MNSNSVIFIIIDGLASSTAVDCMGFLAALTESGQGSMATLASELPSLSRPLYETLLTGTSPVESGIVNNGVSRLSNQTSIFELARRSNLTTAAAAYHWMSELYNRTPFAARDRHTHDPEMNIQHGCFYWQDDYPDCHVLADAEHLRATYNPDFLLIHTMGVDLAGHQSGLDSAEYRNSARHIDSLLSDYLPQWIAQGYQILITSDHGMNNDKTHGGTLINERTVPLFTFGDAFQQPIEQQPAQTQICGTLCRILGIEQHNKSECRELIKL